MKRAKGNRNGLLPNSLRIISSCLKTVSSNAGTVASTVRSAGASVAASVAAIPESQEEKDQILWAGFDKLELSPSCFKNVLLLGYSNGFQVLEVEDASNVREIVSKRDGAVTFLQLQPIPAKSEGTSGYSSSHPMLLVVASEETNCFGVVQGSHLSALLKENENESQGNCMLTPTAVRFFSLRSNGYVHVLRFRSAVCIVRCSERVIAVALTTQIYCFDADTLENKFSVLTYPIQGSIGISIGYGPMAVGSRWLAYASNNPLMSNSGRLSPQNLTPSPGVSPSTSPGNGSFIARYAMESSKQLAVGILNLGDMGYKKISKYCQDLLPEGSTSPISPSSCKKIGRLMSATHPNEAENAGMVVIKDFVSKDVISQFRAHNSPISALCFDPSGTLLVTASVNGNNINIFRIMPKCTSGGSSSERYDWNSSHVHLYKLHRGLTSTIIQDISFSYYSQWISVVSARGTCHVYLLSPFGGDTSIRAQSLSGEKPVLIPDISLPWWSTSSFVSNQQFCAPPPVTLSVVSRVKNGNSGWLNTVSTAAASAAGRTPVPSGAVAAIFHNTMHSSYREINLKTNTLEYLLVCSPSGHVIQHELHALAVELSDNSLKIGPSSHFSIQEEELSVNAEPVQWWDVCRRSNWPERFEWLSNNTLDNHKYCELMEVSDCEENDITKSTSSINTFLVEDTSKASEKARWYLSKAELKGSSGQIPIWQKSKICFYTMKPPRNDRRDSVDSSGGEIEIEKYSVHDVEIRQKELLPVFQHFHDSHCDSNNRSVTLGEYSAVSSEICLARNKLKLNKADRHGTLSVESSCIENYTNVEKASPGFSSTSHMPEEPDHCRVTQMDVIDEDNSPSRTSISILSQTVPGSTQISNQDGKSFVSDSSNMITPILDVTLFHENDSFSFGGRPLENEISLCLKGETSASSDCNYHTKQMVERNSDGLMDAGEFLQEGYCKLSEPDDCHDSTEAITDVDSNCSHCGRDRPDDDGDMEDVPGGIFAFSDEGLP